MATVTIFSDPKRDMPIDQYKYTFKVKDYVIIRMSTDKTQNLSLTHQQLAGTDTPAGKTQGMPEVKTGSVRAGGRS